MEWNVDVIVRMLEFEYNDQSLTFFECVSISFKNILIKKKNEQPKKA